MSLTLQLIFCVSLLNEFSQSTFLYIFHQFITDKPSCTITLSKENGESTLICSANGNPDDYKYKWDFAWVDEPEYESAVEVRHHDKKSYLKLGKFPRERTHSCRATNSIGPGSICEINVEGKQQKFTEQMKILLFTGANWGDVSRSFFKPLLSGFDRIF